MSNSAQILVRCSEEEKAVAESRASEMGVSVSEMFRRFLSDPVAEAPSEKIVGKFGEIVLADVKRQAGSAWFMEKVWPKVLDGSLKRACGQYSLKGTVPTERGDRRLVLEPLEPQ